MRSIREQDGEGLVPHHRLGAEDGMAQTQGLGLAQVDAGHMGRQDIADDIQQILFARVTEFGLHLVGLVEMILDRALGAAGHEDQLRNACRLGLLRRVLDEWLIHHRQHLLGAGLGGRQEASP
jgi:hypothetical protein